MISIILISINLMGYFIGTRLQGWRGSDSIKLGVLQLCAKVQELLIVASLSTVIFHVVRSEMTFGPGIPLGWLGAGFRFTTLSYLWSSDLWGSIRYKHASVLRKFGLVLLLFVSGIITVLAGPSSAVLMVPRVMDWPAGGGRFWLNGSQEDMWPHQPLPVPLSDCPKTDPVAQKCLAHGYHSIYNVFRNRQRRFVNDLISFELEDSRIRKNVHARLRLNGQYVIDTWAITAHTPTATTQAAWHTLWGSALQYLRDTKPAGIVHPDPDLLSYGDTRIAVVETKIPAVRIVCNEWLGSFSTQQESFEVLGSFPMYPGHGRPRYLDEGGTAWTNLSHIDMTDPVRARLSQGNGPGVFAVAVDLPTNDKGLDYLGVFLFRLAADEVQSWETMSCTIDSWWAAGKMTVDQDYRAIKYNFAADQGHILVDSEVGTEDFRWRDFTAPMDGSWERVGLSSAWFDDLGAKVPVSPNQPNDTSVTTVESILNLAISDTLQGWDALQATELALAVLVVDGLSRSSSFMTSNYSAMLEPLVSHPWTAETAKKLVNLNKPKTAFSPESANDMVSVKLQMILPGYAMSARGWFDRLCMAILMAHAVIALGHTLWVLWHGETSDAWESMTELIALSLESDRPSSINEPGLSNTSAGVRTWAPLKEVGWVEAIDQPVVATAGGSPVPGKHLQLRFGKSRTMDHHAKNPICVPKAKVEYY
ncbi:hypothetical protein D7B24_007435 [Verticillium nonalfalfae]|uniref:Uncharacterized protein n=1 Tax=Verticillium nonalfalfae TaxID=1051616 RepID=A0A3M9YKM8_9PEZI|nr:uncharacterized protein D7B24_007435 [Verticillium nonalfalfae]RNJ60512.1 hypothetical protein D7B24_007435 [Verticillium nonalfalfae]